MLVTRTSQFSGIEQSREIDITPKQLAAVSDPRSRELIQNLVRHLSDDDREFLLTGVTPDEWDNAMPKEDDE